MKPLSFMLIAGEPSGDANAAELVAALRSKVIASSQDSSGDVQPLRTALVPRFFGAGGPRMAAAGVELAFDLTKHSVIGISEVLKNYLKFRRLFNQLLELAIERQPNVIIGVDYGGFNLRFGKAIKDYVRKHRSAFTPWNPKLVQFVSPQVWASRPARAYTLAENYDLLLSIFPFEKEWYAARVPDLRVEFVGHPMVGRSLKSEVPSLQSAEPPNIVLLPGSRVDELRRHFPVVIGAAELIAKQKAAAVFCVVLPNEDLLGLLRWEFARRTGLRFRFVGTPTTAEVESLAAKIGLKVTVQIGNIAKALASASVAITKSGTITMECAFHGVPAVVFYKTSWPTYLIARQVISVKHLAMPNLLAGEEIYPEFVQDAATPENISRAALDLLRDDLRRRTVKNQLAKVIALLGMPGATSRAADAILSLLP